MAYLGIDVGGTKTLVARLSDNGIIEQEEKFPTPKNYQDFVIELEKVVVKFNSEFIKAVGVGIPGKVDYEHGVGLTFGNLGWKDIPIRNDVERITGKHVVVDNDANLAGLSEAMLRRHHRKVLYVTISTGIGTGYIVDQKIDPGLAESEGGHILIEHNGELVKWESFASGHAIVETYGKRAEDIHDEPTWREVAHKIAIGMIDLLAVIQPDVVVLGGSVGTYFDRYGIFLNEELRALATHMVDVPPIEQAGRPEKAVVYGCYDLAKSYYA
jgi:predicted NBD/HSP70 family sugar kinase